MVNQPLDEDPPDWVHDAVFYQIFPDRFARLGRPAFATMDWGSPPTFWTRAGGTLRGITRRLDYLSRLGVNALYLGPVFKSGSNHGYDTFDYMLVDPRFGSNEDLRHLVRSCHRRGIRVLLDAVLQHTGMGFFAFGDLVDKGPGSEFRHWYFPTRLPLVLTQPTYTVFGEDRRMPKLNLDAPEARNYFLNAVEYWMRFADIDGWRLDVADRVSQEFWRAFRSRVKTLRPDAYILGEVWSEAGTWLEGDQFDGATNYRFRGAVLDFFLGKSKGAVEFEEQLTTIRGEVRAAALPAMYNLLESHDTPRLGTILHGNRAVQMAALALEFAYPGIPALYYGSEIGLVGGEDPDCRRCMNWDASTWDTELLEFHRRLIAFRRGSAALRRGAYRPLTGAAKPDLMAFERHTPDETVVAAFNRGSETARLRLKDDGDGGTLDLAAFAAIENGSLAIGPQGFALLSRYP